MLKFWSEHWDAVTHSFDRERVLAQSRPASVGAVLLIGVVAVYLPALVSPLASLTRMSHPWLVVLVFALGSVASLCYWRTGGRGDLGAVLTLTDTGLYVSAVSLAVALSTPPGSYAYAALLGLMMAGTQAREHGLTLPLALVFCVPSIGITAAVGQDLVSTFLVAMGCAVAIWVSYHTGRYRQMQRTQERLLSALRASHQVADASVEVALTSTLIGIGDFMHELRNAQAAVCTNLAYLSEAMPPDDDRADAVRDASEGLNRMVELTKSTLEDLKTRSSPSPGCRLDHVLKDWCSSHRNNAVALEGPLPPFQIRGAAADLESVLVNLERNALQAGARKMVLRCSLEPSAGAIVLRVEDDGPGLPQDRLDLLFKPFISLSRQGGTGLGLYLCRRRVELMGGTIAASNAVGGGALFEILLPGSPSPHTYGA